MTQGNRVNQLCGNEAGEEFVIPGGDLAPAAQRGLGGRLPEQVMGDVFNGGEIGRSMVGSDTALVIAKDMSMTQWRLFSIDQWLRTTGPRRCASMTSEVM